MQLLMLQTCATNATWTGLDSLDGAGGTDTLNINIFDK